MYFVILNNFDNDDHTVRFTLSIQQQRPLRVTASIFLFFYFSLNVTDQRGTPPSNIPALPL